MPEPNSQNTGKGKSFQTIAAEVFGYHFRLDFRLNIRYRLATHQRIINLILFLMMAIT